MLRCNRREEVGERTGSVCEPDAGGIEEFIRPFDPCSCVSPLSASKKSSCVLLFRSLGSVTVKDERSARPKA